MARTGSADFDLDGHAKRSASRLAAVLLAGSIALLSDHARADEGGVSFWIPGFFGSLAATPQVPGFTVATMYYHTSVSAGGDVAFARQVPVGRINVPFTGNVNASLQADADLGILNSTIRLCNAGARWSGCRRPRGAVRPQQGRRGCDADRRARPDRLYDRRQPHRQHHRVRRPDPAVQPALESRGSTTS